MYFMFDLDINGNLIYKMYRCLLLAFDETKSLSMSWKSMEVVKWSSFIPYNLLTLYRI